MINTKLVKSLNQRYDVASFTNFMRANYDGYI